MLKTVRLLFSKTGRARFISHLDLNRTMTRAVRRAGIPLWYTEGFNRHPYLTFTAPLSLGYEGLAEIMEIRLEEDMPSDELVSKLQAVMPEGLCVFEAFEAQRKAGELKSAAYTLHFACPADPVRELLAQPSILVEKFSKKKVLKTVDIAPAFAGAVVEDAENGCKMTVTLPCGGEGTVNPSLFVTALKQKLGEDIPCHVVRTALFGPDGCPFR